MESAELREANKRIRLLELDNEVLRRAAVYLGRGINQNDVASRPRVSVRGDPGFAVLPRVGFFPPGALRLAGGPCMRA